MLSRLPKILSRRFQPSLAASGSGAIPQLAITAMDLLAVAMVLYVLVRYALFLTAPVAD